MIGPTTESQKPLNFVDHQFLMTAFLGKSIAIVGSGPGVLDNKEGFIDSHDVVVRVNNYKTGKYSDKTGIRTDVHYSFFGTSIKKSADQLKMDGVYLCMCKCPDSRFIESDWHVKNGKEIGIDYRYIYERRKDWWFCNTYIPTKDDYMEYFELLGKHIPTTGFACILDFLGLATKSIYITGFDFFESKMHNVDEPWKNKNKEDPFCHVPRTERQWLRDNNWGRRLSYDNTLEAIILNA